MSISSPFIKRPVATSLIAAAFLLVGVACYFLLPVSALPQVDFPTIPLIENAKEDLGAPETLAGAFQGAAAAFRESLSSMPFLIAAALLALRIAGQDLNVIGIIAIILLIGIVKKNGIMIVDVALKLEREEGMGREEAVVAGLRPILMTTACAFLGGAPMILGHGPGSEFRQPLGWAIVGGLLVSQVLTLFSTPVIYVYLDRLRRRFGEEARHEPRPGLAQRPGAPAAAGALTLGV